MTKPSTTSTAVISRLALILSPVVLSIFWLILQTDGTLLVELAESGDVRAMSVLLACGANPDAEEPKIKISPLTSACVWNQTAAVDLLLRYGASAKFHTPIASAGDPEIIEALIQHGADPNSVDSFGGSTCLVGCAASGKMRSVLILLQHGANPTIRDSHNQTPAMAAAQYGYQDVAKLLVKAEADWRMKHH